LHVQIISGLTRTTHYDYDKRNRQTKVTDANGGETNYSYYKDDKTASIKDAVGNKTEYTYDVAGRLVTERLTNSQANNVAPIDLGNREYKYDLVNNRIKTTDRNSKTTNYAYDNLNRITTEAWADGSKTFTYSYDKNGNRLTADDGKIKYVNSYDKTDLLETVDRFDDGNLNPKVRFNYEYDEIGNLTQTQEVANSIIKATTAYEYDDRYLNTKITQKGAGLADKEVKFTYNTKGENTKIERYLDGLLKVTTDNAYDIYGRLTGIAHVKGITPTNPTGTPISDDVYVLDNLNRLQTQTKGGQVKESVMTKPTRYRRLQVVLVRHIPMT
jgi:YD repeat-containing protein